MNHRITLLVIWLLALGGNWAIYHLSIHVRIAHHILMTAFLVWWLIRRGIPIHPLTLPGLAMIVWTGISALLSDDPRMALEFAWHWWVNILLLYVAIDWARQNRLRMAYSAIFGVLAASTGIMLLQIVLDPLARPGGLFLLTNLGGAMLAVMAIPLYDHLSNWDYSWGRWITWPVMLLVGLALLMNASRGSWLAVGLSAAVYLWLNAPTRFRFVEGWGVVKRIETVFPLVVIAGLVVMVMVFFSNTSGRAAGDSVRTHLWSSAARIFVHKPFTGAGPGLFPQAYRPYGVNVVDDDRLTGAHNLYLNIIAELGLPGLFIGVCMAWGLVPSMLNVMSAKMTMPRERATLAALLGIAVHMLVDNFPVTAYALLVAVLVADLTAQERTLGFTLPGPALMRLATGANVCLVALLVILGIAFIGWDAGQVYYERSIQSGNIEDAQQAIALDPANRLYQLHLARLEGEDVQQKVGIGVNLSQWAMTNYGRFWR